MDWFWGWNSDTLATWCEEPTHWKRPWCWAKLKVGGEGDDRGRELGVIVLGLCWLRRTLLIEVCCNCEVSKDMPQHGKPLLEASSIGCLLSSDLAVTALLSLSFSVKVLVHNLSFKTQASTYTSSGIGSSRFYLPLIGRKPRHHFLFSETWVEDDLNLCYSTSADQPGSIRIYCELNKNTKSQLSSLT